MELNILSSTALKTFNRYARETNLIPVVCKKNMKKKERKKIKKKEKKEKINYVEKKSEFRDKSFSAALR